MRPKYCTKVIDIAALGNDTRQAIASLYLSYYDGADAAQVLNDLQSKTAVLLLYHADVLVGFTTFEVYERIWQHRPVRIVFSGDTVVRRDHWGQQALAFAWIRHIRTLKEKSPRKPVYWFLIVKGHRTYKYLPAFTYDFYPHWEGKKHELKPLLDMLAAEKFADAYDAKSGVIAFASSRGHLKQSIAYPKTNEKNNPAVRFFLESNPGFIHGNELACICSFDDDNLKPLTKRILYKKEKSA